MMITQDTINFLKKIPPFQFLKDADLQSIVADLSIEFFPKGTFILTQDGPPSEALRVIKKGGVKVYLSNDDEIVIDYKSEGDCFGYISLISGDRSRANVRTIEDTLCYRIPRDTILKIISREPLFSEFFMKSFFKNYLDKTYKEMQSKNLLFKEGEKLLYTTPVKSLISRGAVTSPSDISIREAASIMSQYRISSLVLTGQDHSPEGIITDRDLRDKVVARGMDTSGPVAEIMSKRLVTVDANLTCFDALTTMIKNNIHHLIVTENGRLKGIVTNHDFMVLQGISPLSLLKSISAQKSIEALSAIHEKINKTIMILLREGARPVYILKIITELHDRLIQKIISLSIKELGDSPSPFVFFVYGAEGRQEETFKTVFRCAIAYRDIATYTRKQEMQDFCQRLTGHLHNIFERCNLPLFDINPFGKEMAIYGDMSEWTNTVISLLRSQDKDLFTIAKKILDLRPIYGDCEIGEILRDRLFSHIREKYLYENILSKSVSQRTSPVGFFRKFVIDESGRQMERLDIKEKGILPIVDSIRALSIACNVQETSTIERLNSLSRKGLLRDIRDDINSAFEFMLYLLLQAQLIKKEKGLIIDNFIETERLSLLEKKTLREVFQIIQGLQDKTQDLLKKQETFA